MVHFTIIDYPRIFSPNSPDMFQSISRFKKLSDILGPQSVFWRYDPIFFTSVTSEKYHLERFESIAAALQGATHRCYFSFIDFYAKTKRRIDLILKENRISAHNPDLAVKQRFSQKLADIARRFKIVPAACCEPEIVGNGIEQAHCIGPEILTENNIPLPGKCTPHPTRKGCGCIYSIDIGAYDTCLHGCEYCYAVRNSATALKRYQRHDPENPLLIPD